VIHAYRDSSVITGSFLESPFLRSFVLFWLLVVGLVVITGMPFTRDLAEFFGGPFALLLVAVYFAHRVLQQHSCREIRLGDDGTCELETRRVTRLHVGEIRSVRYTRDPESKREDYTIKYRDGSLQVGEEMTGFADFLTRLRALNPALDLSSFPPSWPTPVAPRPVEKPDPVNRFFRSALFPLIVVILLVYLASDALGK
jgi:hypothetical protein